jgi:hypothetical protein
VSDRRTKFRKGLHASYLPLYDALCALLGPEWQPYYGVRTIKEQDKLYEMGRTAAGAKVTNARGGASAHNYGMATDWCLWEAGKPIWPPRNDIRWLVLSQACEKVGLKWGGSFGDCPHVELPIRGSWNKVREVYLARGLDAAYAYIEKNREK